MKQKITIYRQYVQRAVQSVKILLVELTTAGGKGEYAWNPSAQLSEGIQSNIRPVV